MLQDYSPPLSPRLCVDLADLCQKGRLYALARVIPHSKLTDYINFHCPNSHFNPQNHKNAIKHRVNTYRKVLYIFFSVWEEEWGWIKSLLPTTAQDFADSHFLQQQQLCQVFLPIDDYSVLTKVFADVSLARLHATVPYQLIATVKARLRLYDFPGDLAILMLI